MKRENFSIVKMLYRMGTIVFGVCFVLLLFSPIDTAAQKLRSGTLVNSTRGTLGLTRREMKPLIPVIQSHTDGLMKIFSKYEDRLEDGAVLLSIGPEIWDDLGKFRKKMGDTPSATLNLKQAAALRTVYMDMEKEIVTMIFDEETQFLGEDLDLSNNQMDQLYKVVLRDIGRKQLLLDGKLNVATVTARMKAITADTEASIMKLLFPDQVVTWKKMKEKAEAQATKLVA